MSDRRAVAGRVVLRLLCVVLPACGADQNAPGTQTPPIEPGQVVATDATVRLSRVEHGCWVIETTQGARYEPVNLAPGFHTDGLTVRVVLRDAPGMVSGCMLGPLVTVDSIVAQ